LKALSYSGGIVHHQLMAGNRAPAQGYVDPTRAPRVRARSRARVAANFANFRGCDGH
jgi:hypothetical protein